MDSEQKMKGRKASMSGTRSMKLRKNVKVQNLKITQFVSANLSLQFTISHFEVNCMQNNFTKKYFLLQADTHSLNQPKLRSTG